MVQLANYRTDTARLLRDRSHILVPLDDLDSYINEARKDVARITQCLRTLIAGNSPFGSGSTPNLMIPGGMTPGAADTTLNVFATIAGVEKYHYKYAQPLLRRTKPGWDAVVDLISVSVSWGSAARPTMDWRAWEELQALGRIYSVGVFTYPFLAACQGDGVNQELFLFPVPGQALEMEWDAICLPADLHTNNDVEALPEPFHDAIKFRAASLAYMGQQRFGSSEQMEAQFMTHLGIDRAASERSRVPTFYDVA